MLHNEVQPPEPRSVQPARAEMMLKFLRESLRGTIRDAAKSERLAWRLMQNWAGAVLHMPSLDDVARLARDQSVERRLLRDPSPAAVKHAAGFHGIVPREVAKIFKHRRKGRGLTHERARRSETAAPSRSRV